MGNHEDDCIVGLFNWLRLPAQTSWPLTLGECNSEERFKNGFIGNNFEWNCSIWTTIRSTVERHTIEWQRILLLIAQNDTKIVFFIGKTNELNARRFDTKNLKILYNDDTISHQTDRVSGSETKKSKNQSSAAHCWCYVFIRLVRCVCIQIA